MGCGVGETLRWLLLLEGLGLLAFPLAFSLAPALRDRGWCLAKPLALLVTTLLLWWGASLRLFPSSTPSLIGVIALWGGASLAWGYRRRREIGAWLRRHGWTVAAGEGVFLGLFLGWTLYRAYAPAIAHTEQPMDLMLFNAAARARWFPPEDGWLAGHPVSYYYGGYLVYALLGNLAGVPSPLGYNLALSTAAAMAGMGAFGIGASLAPGGKAWPWAGGISALALLLLPNMEGLLELARAMGLGSPAFWGAVEVKGLSPSPPSPHWYPADGWWWWRATRVIDTLRDGHSLDYTIHEFPFFTFLLGDLHPHASTLPFLIGQIGLATSLALTGGTPSGGWLRRHAAALVTLALWTGALGFMNPWDLPLGLAFLWGGTLLALRAGGPWGKALAVGGGTALGMTLLALVAFLPFYRHLDTPVYGLLPVRGPVSQAKHLLIVWGQFGLLLLPGLLAGLAAALRGVPRPGDILAVVVPLGLFPMGLWLGAALATATPNVGGRLLHSLPLLLLGNGLLVGAVTAYRRDRPLACALALAGVGALLVLAPELFYVVDTFGTRMNTVFKLSFQAWTLLSLTTGPTIAHGISLAPGRLGRRIWGTWALGVGVVGVLLLYYPLGAAVSKTGGFRGPPTLDGLAYLDRVGRSGERAVIAWLSRQARPGDVLVEAVGASYTEYGFIAAATGIPTVLNWPGHQVQWRRTRGVLDGRAEAVRTLYTAASPEEVRAVLERYRVTYVIVGPRERHTYGAVNEALLAQVLEKAFEAPGVTVYRRR